MITEALKNPKDYALVRKCVNLDSILIKAMNAVSSKPYYCADCNCKMHKSTSKNGVDYFARYPGEQHTSYTCRQLEKNKKNIYTTEDPNFTADNMWDHIFIEPSDGSITTRDPGSEDPDEAPDDPFSPSKNNDPSTEEDDFDDDFDDDTDSKETSDLSEIIVKRHPVTSIAPLIDQRLDRLNPNYVINRNRNIMISDVLLAAPSFSAVFDDPMFLDCTRKILEMQPDYTCSGNNILCHIFNSNGEKIYFLNCNFKLNTCS